MSMTMQEIERALRELRLSGIQTTLQTRILQAQSHPGALPGHLLESPAG